MSKRDWTHQSAPSLTHLMYDHIPTIRARIICFYNSVVSLSYWASHPFYTVYNHSHYISSPSLSDPSLSHFTSFHTSSSSDASCIWCLDFAPPNVPYFFLHPIHAVIHFILKPALPYFYDSFTYYPSQSLFCYISNLGSSRTVFVLPSPTSSWFSASFWC